MADSNPAAPPARPAAPTPAPKGVRLRMPVPRRRWLRRFLKWSAFSFAILFVIAVYFWISYGRMIDERLAGEARPVPRIFGQPFEIRQGRGLEPGQLVQRLNDVGYAQRPKPEEPGEFSITGPSIQIMLRDADGKGRFVKVDFTGLKGSQIRRIVDGANKPIESVTLEPPLLAAIAPGQKKRKVLLSAIPDHMKKAVLAIEDRRFYEHPGVDPIRAFGALIRNIRGTSRYLEGASTITQQIIKNTFLTPDQTIRRKLQEQFMALVLDSRYTKDQIFELYLNEVVLGQRGPFAIRGVGEASRIFFGKDVSNVTLSEAAMIAGLIQRPSALNPFRNPDAAKQRRNVVLAAMADAGFITGKEAQTASAEKLAVASRALENEAPYFVDYVSKLVDDTYQGALARMGAVDIYTTLDLHLQRMAQDAVAEGIVQIDKQLSKRKQGQAQVALVAVDPRTGAIRAMVGGRSYNDSQYNRAVMIRRQPGSVFKPFVYLAAFEKMAEAGSGELTPATVMSDEPTVFKDGENDYAPANYKDEYGGPMTLRRALALSRNIVSIKVAERIGYDQVAALWKKVGVGTPALPVPSIALGVFEASPVEIASAFTVFTNGGGMRALSPIDRITTEGNVTQTRAVPPKPIARPQTTYLVTNMMRSVINEGTAASVRASIPNADLAGKTGTTNDQRDAWFVGFTPELLTVVWVGFDNNQPIGLSGSQAALPVWLGFMRRALAAAPSGTFDAPEGLSFAMIDRETGGLATPGCPKPLNEAFLPGTEPHEICPVHGGVMATSVNRFTSWLRRVIR